MPEQTSCYKLSTNIAITAFVLLIFHGLGLAGISNDVFRQFIILGISWVFIVLFPVVFRKLRQFPWFAGFYLGFLRDTPLLFPSFILAGALTPVLTNQVPGLVDSTVLSACFFAIVVIIDRLHLLIPFLLRFGWIRAMSGKPFVEKWENRHNLPSSERIRMQDTAVAAYTFVFGFIAAAIVLTVGSITTVVTGDRNNILGILIVPIAVLFSIGVIRFFYSIITYALLKNSFLEKNGNAKT